MSIDIERLKVDRAYWDQVAPEGATHFNPKSDLARWYDLEESECYNEIGEYWFSSVSLTWSQLNECEMIPRPKAPEAKWVDGLPPVGCEVEYSFGMFQCPDAPIKRAKFIGPDHDNLVIKFLGEHEGSRFTSTSPSCVRPIRTKEQRERDELVSVMCEHLDWGQSVEMVNNAADAILSRYNLEPKP